MSRLEKAPTRRGCEPVRPFAGISLQRVQSLLRAAIEMVEPDRLRQKLGKGRGPRPILLGNSGLVFLELDVESELHHSRAGCPPVICPNVVLVMVVFPSANVGWFV